MRTASLSVSICVALCASLCAALCVTPIALAVCDDYSSRIHAVGGYGRFGASIRDVELFHSGGSTYAVLGVEGSAEEIVDVTDPDGTTGVAGFSGGGGFRLALSGSTVVTTRSSVGVGVYDVSNPASPVFRADVALTQSAYDVSTTTSYAYALGNAGGFYTVRLTGAGSPVLTGELYIGGSTGRVAHYGNYAYAAHALGVTVIDISNPASPSIVRRLSTNAKDVAVDGDRLYAVFAGSVTIYSLTTPSFPAVLSSTVITAPTTVDASGSRMIVGQSGTMRLYDVSVPSTPVLLATTTAFDSPLESRFDGDLVYIASADGALHIVDLGDETAPAALHTLPAAGDRRESWVSNGHLFQVGDQEIQIVSLADPAAPVVALDYPLWGEARHLVGEGDIAYFGVESEVGAYDISDPLFPELLSTVTVEAGGDLALSGTLLAARALGHIKLFDVSDPANPVAAGRAGIGGDPESGVSIALSVPYLYEVASLDGAPSRVWAWDVGDPAEPEFVWALDYGGWWVTTVAASGNRVAVGSDFGVEVFEWGAGPQPVRTGQFVVDRIETLRMSESFLLAGTADGVHIIALDDTPRLVGSIGTNVVRSTTLTPDYLYITDSVALRTFLAPCAVASAVPELVFTEALHLRAYPNPASAKVSLEFALPSAAAVTLRVWDAAGRNVRTLANADLRPAGPHVLAWDRRDSRGRLVPQGVYWVGGEVSGSRVQARQIVVR